MPILKEANILHQDNNIINRTNIYSFNKSDKINYAYIGTSCMDEDKGTLHIGTAYFTYMVNLGKESLVSSSKEDGDNIFQQTTKLSLDIEQTDINSLRTNISYLMTEHNISVHTYNIGSGSSIKVTTIPINHICNKYNDGNVFVTDIIDVDNVKRNLSTFDKSIRFTHIKIPQTVSTSTNNEIALGKYINEKYPGLRANGLIGDLSEIQVIGIENDVLIPLSGYYDSTINMLFFDTPLLINITTYNGNTQIYI